MPQGQVIGGFFARSSALALVTGLLGVGAGRAHADVITVTADRDGYTGYNLAGGDVPGSGVAASLFVGRTSTNFGIGLHFDVSAIPAGATINSVTLRVYQTSGNTSLGLSLHAFLSGSWTEAQLSTQGWNTLVTAGGSSLGTTGSTTLNAYNDLGNAALAAQVSNWVNTPSSNIGLLLDQSSYPPSTNKTFGARAANGGVAAHEPLLVIDYTPVPTPASCLAVAMWAGLVQHRHRRRAVPA